MAFCSDTPEQDGSTIKVAKTIIQSSAAQLLLALVMRTMTGLVREQRTAQPAEACQGTAVFYHLDRLQKMA